MTTNLISLKRVRCSYFHFRTFNNTSCTLYSYFNQDVKEEFPCPTSKTYQTWFCSIPKAYLCRVPLILLLPPFNFLFGERPRSFSFAFVFLALHCCTKEVPSFVDWSVFTLSVHELGQDPRSGSTSSSNTFAYELSSFVNPTASPIRILTLNVYFRKLQLHLSKAAHDSTQLTSIAPIKSHRCPIRRMRTRKLKSTDAFDMS